MLKLLPKIVFGILVLLSCGISYSQKVAIQVLQQGTSYSDSSYYDIVPVGDKFWIGGKYGTLKLIDSVGSLSNISYPSENVDIYKIDHLDEQTLILGGDKGVIYKHNLISKTWETIKIKGYEKACFYNLTVVNDSTAFICGGKSSIAHSEKTVPFGFILKTVDRGLTWKRVYHNAFKMVWCVKYNPFNKKVYALMYTPNRTHLYSFSQEKWQKEQKLGNSIFHEIQFENEKDFVTMGGWMGKNGRIHHNNQKLTIPKSGLIWGRVSNGQYDIYSACDGKIVLGDKSGNYKVFGEKLNKAFNIYETVFTSPTTAIAIGSARTILLIKIITESNFAQLERP
ncbi:WD40/YVTN/BNR-like repeat-containing protein [Emticicia sp. SJ17W-69]|uniref:WD40/YVTN/BNR-like repeat-containing protein n=1 Tax=Emticicia sp. SJ17W-69 TaxID=3421657 RepID=UPI003EBA2F70